MTADGFFKFREREEREIPADTATNESPTIQTTPAIQNRGAVLRAGLMATAMLGASMPDSPQPRPRGLGLRRFRGNGDRFTHAVGERERRRAERRSHA